MELHIVYQDNHFLVVKKDFGITQDLLDENVQEYLIKQNGKFGFCQPLITLSTVSAGLVVYVRSRKAFERMQDADIVYKFLCVTVGKPEPVRGGFSVNVEKLPDGRLGIAPPIKQSFRIGFYYKLLETVSQISLVQISKYNSSIADVRFGLAQLGCPVFGDKLYSGDKLAKNTNLGLMLYGIEFEHPTTRCKMVFKCSPVEDTKPWSYFNLEKLFKI